MFKFNKKSLNLSQDDNTDSDTQKTSPIKLGDTQVRKHRTYETEETADRSGEQQPDAMPFKKAKYTAKSSKLFGKPRNKSILEMPDDEEIDSSANSSFLRPGNTITVAKLSVVSGQVVSKTVSRATSRASDNSDFCSSSSSDYEQHPEDD